MMKYVDYPKWVNYLERIFQFFKKKPKRILDLACGTGIPTILLAQKNYEMIGLDASQAMLDILKLKSSELGLDIKTILAEMTDFDILENEKVDAVISFYDSINYLLTNDDLKKCFNKVFSVLSPLNGIFAFDMNTVYALEDYWDNNTTIREVDNVYSIWQNTYDKSRRISTLRLNCKVANQEFVEIHRERGYTLDEIYEPLKAVGFRDIRFYEHLTFLSPNPKTLRLMVVALR